MSGRNEGGAAAGGESVVAGGGAAAGVDEYGGDGGEGLLDAFEAELEAGERDSAEFGRGAKRARAGEDDEDVDGGRGEGDEDREGQGDDDGDDDPDKDGADDKADTKAAKTKDKDKDDGDGGEDPDGDFVEHEGNKFAVRDLLDAHQFKQNVTGTVDEISRQATAHYRGQVDERVRAFDTKFSEIEKSFELISGLLPNLEPPPKSMLDKSSKDYDPDQYHYLLQTQAELKEAFEAAKQKIDAAREERGKVAEKRYRDYLAEQGALLRKNHPEFGDAAKATAKFQQISDFMGKTYGFDAAEVRKVADARIFSVIMDAMAFQEAKSKGLPKPKNEGGKPRLVKGGGRPDPARGKARPEGAGDKAALDRLHRTGRVRANDLEAVFGEFVE